VILLFHLWDWSIW